MPINWRGEHFGSILQQRDVYDETSQVVPSMNFSQDDIARRIKLVQDRAPGLRNQPQVLQTLAESQTDDIGLIDTAGRTSRLMVEQMTAEDVAKMSRKKGQEIWDSWDDGTKAKYQDLWNKNPGGKVVPKFMEPEEEKGLFETITGYAKKALVDYNILNPMTAMKVADQTLGTGQRFATHVDRLAKEVTGQSTMEPDAERLLAPLDYASNFIDINDPSFSKLRSAWEITKNGESYFDQGTMRRARQISGDDEDGGLRVVLAQQMAGGKTLEDVAAMSGSVGEEEYLAKYEELLSIMEDDRFTKTLAYLGKNHASPGRYAVKGLHLTTVENKLDLLTPGIMGQDVHLLSGSMDAAYGIMADPYLIGGKLAKATRFGKYAADLVTLRGVVKGGKFADDIARAEDFAKRAGDDLNRLVTEGAEQAVIDRASKAAREATAEADAVRAGAKPVNRANMPEGVTQTGNVVEGRGAGIVTQVGGQDGLDAMDDARKLRELAGQGAEGSRKGRWWLRANRDLKDLNPLQRYAVVFTEHMKAGIKDEAALKRLAMADTRNHKAIDAFADWARSRAAATGRTYEDIAGTPSEFVKWLVDADTMRKFGNGEIGKFLANGTQLPNMGLANASKIMAKVGARNFLDMSAGGEIFQDLANMVDDLDAPPAVRNGIRETYQKFSKPIARPIERLIELKPRRNVLRLEGAEGLENFDQMLAYGLRGEERGRYYGRFINAGDTGTRMIVAKEAMARIFDELGVTAWEGGRKYADDFVRNMDQVYAPNNLDVVNGRRVGLLPETHQAHAIAMPDYRDILKHSGAAQARKWGMTHQLFGGGFPQRVVDAGMDTAWKPAVLFRLGFALRAGMEEGLMQMAKGVNLPGGWLKMAGGRPNDMLIQPLRAMDHALKWRLPAEASSWRPRKILSHVMAGVGKPVSKLSRQGARVATQAIWGDMGLVAGARAGLAVDIDYRRIDPQGLLVRDLEERLQYARIHTRNPLVVRQMLEDWQSAWNRVSAGGGASYYELGGGEVQRDKDPFSFEQRGPDGNPQIVEMVASPEHGAMVMGRSDLLYDGASFRNMHAQQAERVTQAQNALASWHVTPENAAEMSDLANMGPHQGYVPAVNPDFVPEQFDELQHRTINLSRIPKGEPGFEEISIGNQQGRSTSRMLVVRAEDGTTAGAVRVNYLEGQPHAIDVQVDQPYQRQGIAEKLYDEAEARGMKINEIALEGAGGETDAGHALGQKFMERHRRGATPSVHILPADDGFEAVAQARAGMDGAPPKVRELLRAAAKTTDRDEQLRLLREARNVATDPRTRHFIEMSEHMSMDLFNTVIAKRAPIDELFPEIAREASGNLTPPLAIGREFAAGPVPRVRLLPEEIRIEAERLGVSEDEVHRLLALPEDAINDSLRQSEEALAGFEGVVPSSEWVAQMNMHQFLVRTRDRFEHIGAEVHSFREPLTPAMPYTEMVDRVAHGDDTILRTLQDQAVDRVLVSPELMHARSVMLRGREAEGVSTRPIPRGHISMHQPMITPEAAQALLGIPEVARQVEDLGLRPWVDEVMRTMDPQALRRMAATHSDDQALPILVPAGAFATPDPEEAQRLARLLNDLAKKDPDYAARAAILGNDSDDILTAVGRLDMPHTEMGKSTPIESPLQGGRRLIPEGWSARMDSSPAASQRAVLDQWRTDIRKVYDTQFRSAETGRPLTELTRPMVDEELSMDHVTQVARSERPAEVHTIARTIKAEPNWYFKMLQVGFDQVFAPMINGIVRQPLFTEEVFSAMKQLKGTEFLYRSEEAAARTKALLEKHGLDYQEVMDDIQDAYDNVAQEYSMTGMPGSDMKRVPASAIRRNLEVNGSDAHMLRDTELNEVLGTARMEANAEAQLSTAAMQQAMERIIPYIDDSSVRSQFADYARWFSPFMFAQEQFIKRWARTLKFSPEALERAWLMNHGLEASGIFFEDDEGNEMYNLPGGPGIQKVLGKAAKLITGKDYAVPFPVPLTGQVKYSFPGVGDPFNPGAGPMFSVFSAGVQRMFPDVIDRQLQPALDFIGGEQAPEVRDTGDAFQSFIPTTFRRAWAVFGDTKQLTSAQIQAAMYLEAAGQGLPDDASIGQQEEFKERTQNYARIIVLSKAVMGLLSPASPTAQFPGMELNREYSQLLSSGLPPQEAIAIFMQKYPDATPYTVFRSESQGKSPLPQTDLSLDYMTANNEKLREYRLAGGWLLPQEETGDDRNREAYYESFAIGLRTSKSYDEWYRDMKFAKANKSYQDEKEMYQLERASNRDPMIRQRLDDAWSEWSGGYLAQHPIFAEELASTERTNKRRAVLKELGKALTDPDVPDPGHLGNLRTIYNSFVDFETEKSRLPDSNTKAVQKQRESLYASFQTWLDAYVDQHPVVKPFYERIIAPEVDLPTRLEENRLLLRHGRRPDQFFNIANAPSREPVRS